MRATILFLLLSAPACVAVSAQSPSPIIVQAASSLAAKSTTSAPVAADGQSIPDAIKQLEQIKTANDEVLTKQKAALQRLDELQDAADQLRIFAKRG